MSVIAGAGGMKSSGARTKARAILLVLIALLPAVVAASGDTVWTSRYSYGSMDTAQAYSIAIDPTRPVAYVAGFTGVYDLLTGKAPEDFLVLAINKTTGNTIWNATWSSGLVPAQNSEADVVAVAPMDQWCSSVDGRLKAIVKSALTRNSA